MIIKEINDIRRINLHLHTRASDGAFSPAQIVNHAKKIRLDLISITDHDTADAYTELPTVIAPLHILPGMEISSMHQGQDVHILAYGCDFNNQALKDLSKMYHEGRRTRAIKMIELLAKLGMNITIEEVAAMAGAKDLIVRPHIAQVLIQKGYVRNKNEAFDKYIGNFKPAFMPKPEQSVLDVIDIIHQAGGLAIVAHPGKLSNPDFVQEFIGFGIDGLEVWHPDHFQYQVDEFIQTAQNNGLYMTAGSDFHGDGQEINLSDVVPASEIILESVRKLYKEYKCRIK